MFPVSAIISGSNYPDIMAKVFLIIALLATAAAAQVTPRNILASRYTADEVKQSLLPRDKWHPYPTTGAEWRLRLAEADVQAIIKRGEQYLGKDVPPVS